MLKTIAMIVGLSVQVFAQISPEDFIADFESGNIHNVQQVGVDSFSFEIRLDDNHGDTYGWYYFAIADNRGRTATLFLTNPDGWQNSNCNPVVSPDNINWGRVQNVWGQSGWLCFRQYLPADTIWFAQDFPFTVSRMDAYLDTIGSSPYLVRQTLGYSVHDRPIDLVTITDDLYPAEFKKTAYLISRQHPMESPPTFILTGLIDMVLEENDFADYFRRDIMLKAVPIVNVDGVAEGYSRHNVNGINLNRNWQPDIENEQPAVRAVHSDIDDYISSGNRIDLFVDLHAAPDFSDFGFRMSLAYTSPPYYDNQETFLHLLETYDRWQDRSRWRDLDTSYAHGVSCVIMFDMYDLDALTTENPWTRRDDNSFINIQSLYNQGPALGETIYNYLYPLTVYDEYQARIDSIVPGQPFMPMVRDFDRRYETSIEITAVCYETADSELVTLYRENYDGEYLPLSPIPTNDLDAVPGDGIMSLIAGGELRVVYQQPEMPDRTCERILAVEEPSGIYDSDVTLPQITLKAYPNPFNSSCRILVDDADVSTVEIFDIAGRLVNRLSINDGHAIWDGRTFEGQPLASGIYFARLNTVRRSESIKIVLLR
jgi:hypothetical protein